jgi:hypothetical protein
LQLSLVPFHSRRCRFLLPILCSYLQDFQFAVHFYLLVFRHHSIIYPFIEFLISFAPNFVLIIQALLRFFALILLFTKGLTQFFTILTPIGQFVAKVFPFLILLFPYPIKLFIDHLLIATIYLKALFLSHCSFQFLFHFSQVPFHFLQAFPS